MTTELEKQFFETFGIEPTEEKYCYYQCKNPKFKEYCCEDKNCKHFKHYIEYPQITDRHYLELIATLTCISSKEFAYSNIQELKKDILKEAIKQQYGFDKHQVQAIFEGER